MRMCIRMRMVNRGTQKKMDSGGSDHHHDDDDDDDEAEAAAVAAGGIRGFLIRRYQRTT